MEDLVVLIRRPVCNAMCSKERSALGMSEVLGR